MTKIAFLSHSAVPSGAELSLLRSVRARRPKDHLLVIFAEHGPLVEEFRLAGAEVVVEPVRRRGSAPRRDSGVFVKVQALLELVAYSRRVRRVLRSAGAEVVVGRSLRAVLYGRVASWRLPGDPPFVWSVHDRLTRDYLGWSAFLYRRLVAPSVAAMVVNSRSTLATVPHRATPVLVLPPGLDIDDRPAPAVGPAVKRILTLGRLTPWKGQDLVIRAFAAVFPAGDVRLDVVGGALFGEDDFDHDLRALADQLGVGDRIDFHGHVADPASLLDAADVLVHASRIPEPFGAVVLEGMRAGCVVVATAPGGPAETIEDGVTGWLVPAGDLNGLVMGLERIMSMTEEERVRMTMRASAEVRRYDARLLARALFDWLEAVASGTAVAEVTDGVAR